MAERDYTIIGPGGRELTITGPDGATAEQLRAAAEKAFGSAPKQEDNFAQALGRQVLNAGAGALRGAGSIGATILTPYDMLAGNTKSIGNPERRQAMTDALQTMGADTNSLAFQGGKLGGEIAGALGVGGALTVPATGAKVFGATVPAMLPSAANLPLVQAIGSAGFKAGGATGLSSLAARTAGGAITGGAAAGLVDPEQAGMGALIGGALPGALQVAGKAGKAVAQGAKDGAANVLGLATGVGAEPIRQAVKAGRQGNAAFVDNMRGNVPIDDVLDEAKRGLDAMRSAKGAQYRSGMVPIKNDQTVLNFTDLDAAFQKAGNIATFKGQVKNQRAAEAITRMREAVDEWKSLDPQQFHTPEGMDALKQRLSAILEGIPFEERGARLAAGEIYSAAKATIGKQAPTYAKVMKDYQTASDSIKEIERALSLGDRASKDTAMRKLQSLMRNNVQTNYGNRLNLANELEASGNVELLPSLAGQALSSATPRSLSGQLGSGGALLGSLMTGNPLPLAALPFQSPRLVGEAAYKLGGMLGPGQAPMQAGQNALLGAPRAAGALTQNDLMQMLYRAAPVAAAGR